MGEWVEIGVPRSGEGRSDLGMTFDATRNQVARCGIGDPGALVLDPDDTWAADYAVGLTGLDSVRLVSLPERLVLTTSFHSDTVHLGSWSLPTGAVSWMELDPGPANGREFFALASRPDGTAVLFGGYNNPTFFGDTWILSGDEWAPLPEPREPSLLTQRAHVAMAPDPEGRILLFGGNYEGGGPLPEHYVWLLEGETWSEPENCPEENRPPPRYASALAYDSARRRTVLFGGTVDNDGGELADTWEWDGVCFRQVDTSSTTPPSPRVHAGLAFDPMRRRVVLFGGRSRTFPEVDATQYADTFTYGVRGNACDSDEQCNTGYCVAHICCDQACDSGTCTSGRAPGTCVPER